MRNISPVLMIPLCIASTLGQQPDTSAAKEQSFKTPARVMIQTQEIQAVKKPPTVDSGSAALAGKIIEPAATRQVGGYAGVVQASDQEIQQATMANDRLRQAQAATSKAKAIEAWAAVDKTQTSRYPEAIEAYRIAAQSEDPPGRALAQNNIGVLLLRSDKPSEAIAEFRKIDFSSIQPEHKAVYQFNYGRALERTGDLKGAYAQYQLALDAKPDLAAAVEGAFRVLRATEPPQFERIASVAKDLLDKAQTEVVASSLHRTLRETAKSPKATVLLTPLVQYYATAQISPQKFGQEEMSFLRELESGGTLWQQAVREIRMAYLDDLGLASPGPQAFRFWTAETPRAEAMSRLLKTVGDFNSRSEKYVQAVARYQYAWAVDSENVEAVVYLAALLRDHAEVDPDHKVFQDLIHQLFYRKGEAYSHHDLLNILRLHTVLGTIFEQQAKWGPVGSRNSALFQWERALMTAKEIKSQNASFPPFPGLYSHLATVYAALNKNDQAAENLLNAAEGFLELRDLKQAREAVTKIDAIPSPARNSVRANKVRDALQFR